MTDRRRTATPSAEHEHSFPHRPGPPNVCRSASSGSVYAPAARRLQRHVGQPSCLQQL
jgi:hypothetical protein